MAQVSSVDLASVDHMHKKTPKLSCIVGTLHCILKTSVAQLCDISLRVLQDMADSVGLQ